ncbi:four helix bundle protein [uncultured Chryseobacterium sp.]|uniref:four helix bundle protein n=1 Tax=uncultured Chryseobacterium sp. TaxID=259322 RepID=UPI0027DDA865|nr:four helix bundle protein [uncultured Chryseobacterium sp.]
MGNEELKMKDKGKNILKEKSFTYSVSIVELYKKCIENKEFVMSKQLLRSGTAVGAMIREAEFAQSRPDFIHKLSVALKEANESHYWLELMHCTDYMDTAGFNKYSEKSNELISMLVASIKTSKQKLNR